MNQNTSLLYLAYAGNMHPAQIDMRCEMPSILGIARLPDHRIGFFDHSEKWDGGMASAVECKGEEIYGILYELTFKDAGYLDICQGVRADGSGGWFNYPVDVVDQGGSLHSAFIFKRTSMREPSLPSREYLEFILAAARIQGLPEPYLGRLGKLESRPAGCVVPLEDRIDRFILASQNCNCS